MASSGVVDGAADPIGDEGRFAFALDSTVIVRVELTAVPLSSTAEVTAEARMRLPDSTGLMKRTFSKP